MVGLLSCGHSADADEFQSWSEIIPSPVGCRTAHSAPCASACVGGLPCPSPSLRAGVIGPVGEEAAEGHRGHVPSISHMSHLSGSRVRVPFTRICLTRIFSLGICLSRSQQTRLLPGASQVNPHILGRQGPSRKRLCGEWFPERQFLGLLLTWVSEASQVHLKCSFRDSLVTRPESCVFFANPV